MFLITCCYCSNKARLLLIIIINHLLKITLSKRTGNGLGKLLSFLLIMHTGVLLNGWTKKVFRKSDLK